MVSIESDLQQADNRTGIVTATGNVRIVYPTKGMVATARQAQYFSKEARLVLSGDVEVIDADGQRIRAERLVYLLGSERLQAEPAAGRQVLSKIRLQSSSGPAPRPLMP
jgi:lipopolysaccharide export system protein LptA